VVGVTVRRDRVVPAGGAAGRLGPEYTGGARPEAPELSMPAMPAGSSAGSRPTRVCTRWPPWPPAIRQERRCVMGCAGRPL